MLYGWRKALRSLVDLEVSIGSVDRPYWDEEHYDIGYVALLHQAQNADVVIRIRPFHDGAWNHNDIRAYVQSKTVSVCIGILFQYGLPYRRNHLTNSLTCKTTGIGYT